MHTEREIHSEWVFSSTDFSLKLCCQPEAQVICTASTNYLTMDDSCILRFAVLCATTVEKQNIREQRLKKKKSLTCICSYTHCLHYVWTPVLMGIHLIDNRKWQNMVPPATESSTYKRLEFGAPIDISSLWYFDMEIMPSSLCFLRYLSLTWGKLKLRLSLTKFFFFFFFCLVGKYRRIPKRK